ncbi:hypothetical protein ATANTOWER_018834 [Ataeniobius toweri]|uniref:Uncharacterized protein n=1 Tax=Ataeniobius toweri TaxID=208326 RepID=A0ABU7CHW7_9TELE|nr:hypothetical protein [Ataeniobius toweri]
MFRPLLENQGCSSSDRQAPYNPTISRSASWSSSLGDGSASEDSDTETEQQSRSRGSWCLSPAIYGREVGYTLDRAPVHRRTTQRHTGQTTRHT